MKKDVRLLFKNFAMLAILSAVMYIIPKVIGLSREGFDVTEVLSQYNTYVGFGMAAVVILAILAILQFIITKDDDKYGNSIFMSNTGEYPSFKFWKRFSSMQLYWLSLVVFSILGLISFSLKQTQFTGVGVLKQQFTVIDSIVFSSALVPIAENLDAIALLALAFFGLQFIARKYNTSSSDIVGFAFALSILIGIYGVANHLLRYVGQELNLMIVGIFWTVGSFITISIGNFIPFLNMHFVNNVLFDLARYFAADSIKIYFAAMIITVIIGYMWYYGQVKKQKMFGLLGDERRLTKDEIIAGIE